MFFHTADSSAFTDSVKNFTFTSIVFSLKGNLDVYMAEWLKKFSQFLKLSALE